MGLLVSRRKQSLFEDLPFRVKNDFSKAYNKLNMNTLKAAKRSKGSSLANPCPIFSSRETSSMQISPEFGQSKFDPDI